jgi:hypothetical protein
MGLGAITSKGFLVKVAAIAAGLWAFAQWGSSLPKLRK